MSSKSSKKIIKKPPRYKKPIFILGTTFFLPFIVVTLLMSTFFILYSGRVYPGVAVNNVLLSGKTVEEARQILFKKLEPRFPTVLTLSHKERTWTIETASIAAAIDYQKTAVTAVTYGRKGSVLGNIEAISTAIFSGITFPTELYLDEIALTQSIATVAADIDIPIEESAITIKRSNGKPFVEVSIGRNGRRLDLRKTANQIKRALVTQSSASITLPVEELLVQTTKEERDRAQKRALTLLDKSLNVKTADSAVTLSGEDLIPFIAIQNGTDREKIASWAATLAKQVNHAPQDATFQFSGNRVTIFKPSKDGLTLDEKRTITLLSSGLTSLEATTAATLVVDAPVKTTPPRITTAQANNLGIQELIGQGISFYAGSSLERIHNLKLLTSRLNGTLIPPGETFSVDKTVGDISTATGYKQAFIIQNGRTILGDGGGVCQPTTTLFRAVLHAGLPIEERHAHAYRVHYYEDGGFQPGFDATIFLPQVDFKFKNDTANYILIQAYTVPSELKLVFELYGTKDGREIYISPGRVWDQAPAPPPLYQDDPTLPKGTVKQVDFAAPGAKAAFDYKVTKNGQVIQERTFYSNFRPWQAIFLKGTKE